MPDQVSFFDQWFQGDWADRNAINRNAQELADVEQNEQVLFRLVQRQHDEILQLRAMVTGLANVLVAKGITDSPTLQAAVQAAYDVLVPPPPPQPAIPRQGFAPPPPPGQVVTCIKCYRHVSAAQTTITANGLVCDACA